MWPSLNVNQKFALACDGYQEAVKAPWDSNSQRVAAQGVQQLSVMAAWTVIIDMHVYMLSYGEGAQVVVCLPTPHAPLPCKDLAPPAGEVDLKKTLGQPMDVTMALNRCALAAASSSSLLKICLKFFPHCKVAGC